MSEGKLFPPRGKWGERTYLVNTQINSAAASNNSQTGPLHVVNSTINNSSTINLKDNIMNTGDVCRTKQATLIGDGNTLKLGPELVVSINNYGFFGCLHGEKSNVFDFWKHCKLSIILDQWKQNILFLSLPSGGKLCNNYSSVASVEIDIEKIKEQSVICRSMQSI